MAKITEYERHVTYSMSKNWGRIGFFLKNMHMVHPSQRDNVNFVTLANRFQTGTCDSDRSCDVAIERLLWPFLECLYISDSSRICRWTYFEKECIPVGCVPTAAGGGGGVCRGVSAQMACLSGGCLPHTPPPVDRMTDARENITLPQLRWGR